MWRRSRAFSAASVVGYHVPSLPRRASRACDRGTARRFSLVLVARSVPLVLCAAVLVPRAARAETQVSDVDRQIAAASGRPEALVEQHNAARSDPTATRARAAATSERNSQLATALD